VTLYQGSLWWFKTRSCKPILRGRIMLRLMSLIYGAVSAPPFPSSGIRVAFYMAHTDVLIRPGATMTTCAFSAHDNPFQSANGPKGRMAEGRPAGRRRQGLAGVGIINGARKKRFNLTSSPRVACRLTMIFSWARVLRTLSTPTPSASYVFLRITSNANIIFMK